MVFAVTYFEESPAQINNIECIGIVTTRNGIYYCFKLYTKMPPNNHDAHDFFQNIFKYKFNQKNIMIKEFSIEELDNNQSCETISTTRS